MLSARRAHPYGAWEQLNMDTTTDELGQVDVTAAGDMPNVCVTFTVEDLTLAIKNGIDMKGMLDEQAQYMAQHVLNFFGYNERIIDNILEPEDRDAFYMLEDTGILTTEREETTLYDGREWRIHYWLFRKDRIVQLISGESSVGDETEEADSVYDEIPDDVWTRE